MEKNILALVFFSSKQRERDERETRERRERDERETRERDEREREERRVLESWRFLLAEGLRE